MKGTEKMSLTKGNQTLNLTGLRFDANLGAWTTKSGAPAHHGRCRTQYGQPTLAAPDDELLHVLDYRRVRTIIIEECTAVHVNLLET